MTTCQDDAVNYDPRPIALSIARGRIVFGIVVLILPGVVARLVLGSSSVPARALLRMVGIRDIALGIGAITNLKEQNQDAEWVSMGALSDAGDALAMLLAPIGWRRIANALFSGGAAAAGLVCARQLADARKAQSQ
jgi:uncharacterized protein YjeT (DUF2065 family)